MSTARCVTTQNLSSYTEWNRLLNNLKFPSQGENVFSFEKGWPGAAIFIQRLEAMRMNSVLTAVLFLAWFIRRAARQAWLLGIPRSRHHNTRIPANRSGWLARLSYNRKVDFCCVQSRCRDLFKASQRGSCDQGLSSISRFYVLPLNLTDFSKPPEQTQNFSPPRNHIHFSILIEVSLIRVLSIKILSKITKKKS